MDRVILHVDVNNAFLSWSAVDMLKNGYKEDIRYKYAIIGGDESQRRGIVLAKSFPCKKKGVITGESIYSARRKCPYLEVYKPSYEVYRRYSNLMYNYLCTYSNIIERYSIDECFLDYTNSQKLFGDPVKVAYKIKGDIKRMFGFTVNVGVGNNKLLAKMASDFSKPDKVHTLFSYDVEKKMWPLDVADLFMIGKSSAKRLKELNINTIYDLAHSDINYLTKYFKSMGKMMWEYANGIDESAVEYKKRDAKSISSSTVLPYNYINKDDIYKVFKMLSMDVGRKLRDKKLYAYKVGIWIKYADFVKVSKQNKLKNCINTDEDIYKSAVILFDLLWNNEKVRALCVDISDFTAHSEVQLDIFNANNQSILKNDDKKLQGVMDSIRSKYGNSAIGYADSIKSNRK